MLSRITFKTWICIIVVIFFIPFIGIGINSLTNWSIGDLYTLGLDRKDFFTVWIALFGAIGIAFNIHQNHLRTTNQDKQLIKQTEQIELQSKSQRDSRFSKGVELLGNANESARTGAAYSLFFLAKDYPEEFAKPVFEILCSHVRSITTTEEYKKRNEERPSNEIQSILDLLFRDAQRKLIFDGLKANLAYSCLAGANLVKANLSGSNLFKANLSQTALLETQLYKANLSKVTLFKAVLFKANLSGSDLSEANLSKTNLLGSDLSGSDLSEAKLSKTDLSGADLSKTNLSRADLSASNLFKVKLSGAVLFKANLSGSDLSRTDLSGADLSGIIIDNTTFSEKTILDGTDISQIGLTKIKGKINPKYLLNPENKTNADSQ